MPDNGTPLFPMVPAVKRVTSVTVRDAIQGKRCLNPCCRAPLTPNRTIPLCVSCAAGFNRDDKKSQQQLMEAHRRDMRRHGRRQLMLVSDTNHVMAMPKSAREQIRRKDFNVKGFIRLTRRVIVDVRRDHGK